MPLKLREIFLSDTFKILIVSSLAGFSFPSLSRLTGTVLIMLFFKHAEGLDAIGIGYYSWILSLIILSIISGGILKLLRVKNAIWITLSSVLTLPSYLTFAFILNNPHYHDLIPPFLLTYLFFYPLITAVSILFFSVIIFQVFNVIFNFINGKLIYSIILSVIIIALLHLFTPKFGEYLDHRLSAMENINEIAKAGIEFFVPKSSEFVIKDYWAEYDSTSDSNMIHIFLDSDLRIIQFKAPSYFNPPENCGLKGPWAEEGIYPCTYLATTPKGRIIYTNAPNIPSYQGEGRFVKIDNTVIVLDAIPYSFDTSQTVKLIDSLERSSVEELEKYN